MVPGLTFSNTKRMILLAFTLTAASASYGFQRGPHDELFCNPREAGSVLTQDKVMHVNDLVRVKGDREAPTEILNFAEVQAKSQFPGFAPPSRSDSDSQCCPCQSVMGLGSMLSSLRMSRSRTPHGFDSADKYWVGIVRVAKHSATESYYEIHHLDGWMPKPTSEEVGAEMSGLLVTPEGGLYDPKLVGGELRKELHDIAGWKYNHQLYDVRSTRGAYWFEEAQNNGSAANDDHYVKQITIRTTGEPLCEDGDAFMSDLVDEAEVTPLLLEGKRMHSHAMDFIDLTNDNIRTFWKAAGECIASKAAGNSDRGDVSTMGGLYGDVKRNWVSYREAGMDTVIGFTQHILKNMETLRIDLDAYEMLKIAPTCTYTAFDREAYATVHRPQRPSKLAQINSISSSDLEQSALRKSASKSKAQQMVEAAKARQAAKPKVSKEETRAKFQETLKNAQLDKPMLDQATAEQAAYKAAVEEFDLQRAAGGILVTGKNADWGVDVLDLPAGDSAFWGPYAAEEKKTALAIRRLKDVLKQVDQVDMMLLKNLSTIQVRNTEFASKQKLPYRAAAKAVLDAIPRPSSPEGKLIQEARSHVREVLRDNGCHTPMLCTTSNGQPVEIVGWENIHAYATQPFNFLSSRDGARSGATISIRR